MVVSRHSFGGIQMSPNRKAALVVTLPAIFSTYNTLQKQPNIQGALISWHPYFKIAQQHTAHNPFCTMNMLCNT